jgi:hypothetical protein
MVRVMLVQRTLICVTAAIGKAVTLAEQSRTSRMVRDRDPLRTDRLVYSFLSNDNE